MADSLTHKSRMLLKDTIRKEIDFSKTDQSRGAEQPSLQKPCDPRAKRIDLPTIAEWSIGKPPDLVSALFNRQSRRTYLQKPLSIDELGFLLWGTQGIREHTEGRLKYRVVPSAGACHPLETYVVCFRVKDVPPGIYRYLPVGHELALEFTEDKLKEKLVKACQKQEFIGNAAAVFVWAALPYRTEWRYSLAAHRVILLDAGHVCQNLYLACEAIEAGCCAVGAYDQEALDRLLRVDGENEFVIYLAPVGKVQ